MPQRLISSVLYGVLMIFVLVIVTSFLGSLILRYTNTTEESFFWVLLIFSFIALFLGGFLAGGKSGEKGWFAGALTALMYSCVTFLTQFLSFNEGFDLQQIIIHSGYLITAIFGGMLGVNVRGHNFKEQ
ncbi:TIGR04086 family membrane protein [Salipaludibacillus agaradhaerens]|uniref:TIGR04086 family membrane protein n=1 Tax=Salipaludibacillus agaradhaerens TaxID=76935 RepID=UPI000BB34719|nr:TIGR04086 family membrane protein [Salipaludibacillus agaradhaerens]